MNPQDVKTNADRLRVRDDYLAVLRQQEANLQKTANAMSVMAQTGQAPVAPSDMRSMSEKIADIERLKPMFRRQIMSLMDGKEADKVMNELDNEEIQNAVMVFGEIYKNLKGNYPLGIPAPIFVEFVRRYLRDYNKSVGFLPKSKEERDALNELDALEGTADYVRDQQAEGERIAEQTSLAQAQREQDSADIVTENQLREKYNAAFSAASPDQIRQAALNITGKPNPTGRSLFLAKRILGFDKLTPDEIFNYTEPTKSEIISYLGYDYFRNFGERFSKQDVSDLGTRDESELRNLFIQTRGGDNIWGGEDLVEDISQEPVSSAPRIGKERKQVEKTMFGMLGEVENRAIREEVGLTMESMLGQLKLGYEPSIKANPTVAEITAAMRISTSPEAEETAAMRTGRARGRPTKYATKDEAKAAKNQQNKESKSRIAAKKEITRQVEREANEVRAELNAALKSGEIDQERYKYFMREVGISLEMRIQQKLAEAGLGAAAAIPAYSGAAEFQGLEAVSSPLLEPLPNLLEPSVKEESEPSIPVPNYMKITPEDFNRIDSLSKVDMMGQFTTTQLFASLDPTFQEYIKTLLFNYENPTTDTSVDNAINGLDEAFQVLRATDIKRILGYGLFSKAKSAATGAAKHTKKLIVGRGLNGSAKQKKEFAEKVDFSVSTLPENKSYVPFGKYVLNQRRLNDNKLMVRTVKGGAISGIPTLAISPVLGGIIKKMVGGALPSYNEMSSLSPDEQNTLYKIFKMSQVDNADLLPAPNKTKEEEEMNRFQILKGQVLAGNDSKELIKEFKVMLLKFIHNGKVPKGQGMEIICDLMAMGY